jgi:hypothetical protein
MAHYKNLEQFETKFPWFHSGNRPDKFKLFILGESPEARLRGCEGVKTVLERILEESREAKEIEKYQVEIKDLAQVEGRVFDEVWYNYLSRMGLQNGEVYAPIFHNIGIDSSLPQLFFDNNKPGILSATQEEYDTVANYSKKSGFDTLRVE